jgi:hypothetical protein
VLSPQLGQQLQQTQQLTRRQSRGSLGPTSSGNVRVPTSKGYLLSWPRQEGSVSSGSASGEVPKPAVLKLSTTLQAQKGTVSQIKLSGPMLERYCYSIYRWNSTLHMGTCPTCSSCKASATPLSGVLSQCATAQHSAYLHALVGTHAGVVPTHLTAVARTCTFCVAYP